MKAVIQFTKPEEARALPILLRHSPGTILPNRTYVLDEEAVAELRKSGVNFITLSRESHPPGLAGVGSGERV
jgi:MoaA/NifB/PqqE/SkfB family radical SAM enzyme